MHLTANPGPLCPPARWHARSATPTTWAPSRLCRRARPPNTPMARSSQVRRPNRIPFRQPPRAACAPAAAYASARGEHARRRPAAACTNPGEPGLHLNHRPLDPASPLSPPPWWPPQARWTRRCGCGTLSAGGNWQCCAATRTRLPRSPRCPAAPSRRRRWTSARGPQGLLAMHRDASRCDCHRDRSGRAAWVCPLPLHIQARPLPPLHL